jgi:transcriptional regulator with XRE-family HTH domain
MGSFGETIRALRQEKSLPLRVVAAAIEIDSTLLSRFELGDRFPTDDQIRRFADYFQRAPDELAAQVIADRIIAAYGPEQVTARAAEIVRELIADYPSQKR